MLKSIFKEWQMKLGWHLVLVILQGGWERERERETLAQRANMNEEFVGGSAIIVATRTKMVYATLDALFSRVAYVVRRVTSTSNKK